MMPYQSLAQEHFFHSAGAKRAGITKSMVKEWDRATKGRKLPLRKKKAKIVVNNRLKGSFGAMNPKTNKVEINIKAHKKYGKLDRAELASTVKHELMHVTRPKMTEKEVYKKTAKTKITEGEQNKLIAKLRKKTNHYKVGAYKRKFKLGRRDLQPGELFNSNRSQKARIAIMGM